MGQEDLTINKGVRKVFVKHWIDLGMLSIRTTNGKSRIRGNLLRIPGQLQPLTTPIVEAMFGKIKRIPGVKNVRADLDNWSRNTGAWICTDSVATKQGAATASKDQTASSFNIDGK